MAVPAVSRTISCWASASSIWWRRLGLGEFLDDDHFNSLETVHVQARLTGELQRERQ